MPHRRCVRDRTTRPLDHTTPHDNAAPTARVGALTLRHPARGITLGWASQTPTVHPCTMTMARPWVAQPHTQQECTVMHIRNTVPTLWLKPFLAQAPLRVLFVYSLLWSPERVFDGRWFMICFQASLAPPVETIYRVFSPLPTTCLETMVRARC